MGGGGGDGGWGGGGWGRGGDQLLAAATAKVKIWRGTSDIGIDVSIGALGEKLPGSRENCFLHMLLLLYYNI